MTDWDRGSQSDKAHGALALIKRLLTEQGRLYWKKYAFAMVLGGIAAGATALSAYLVGKVVNAAYVFGDLRAVLALSAATMALFMLKGFATYGHVVVLMRIGNRVIASYQRRVFQKLLDEGLDFFAQRHSTEFIARLNTGAVAATGVLNQLVASVGRDLFSIIGLVGVMIVQDPVMSLFGLVIAPPAFLVLRKLVKRIRVVARKQFVGGTQIIETLHETLQGIRIVKAFTLESTMRERFDRHVAEVEAHNNKLARIANRASPLMESLGGIAVSAAIAYGGYRVIATGATPGEFFSFMTAFLLAYEPAKRLARLNLDINNMLIGVRVLFEVLDSPPTEQPDDGKPALRRGSRAEGRIAFQNVHFRYRNSDPVLRGMTFTAEPNSLTALVGPSGSGKSTVFNLLLRFYDPHGGLITIDGENILDVSRRSLRSQIAYVGQDVFLFRGTIRDNIAFGRLGATENEIVAAAQAANAHDFISAFPKGYDTDVGEQGMQLSGGQRQRIAIARALIKDAPIILLDEATAALDSESELQVRNAMERLEAGRTTLVIAHRLHTISHADRILVIENGSVAESGRHDELLAKNGRYAAFYRLQLQEQEERPAAAV
ncbi:MAG: ABC transporter ATP-binding protein [Pseudolabrys sp.]|nr:ABC transporter ATP-binding protein [Pseudolabrys sp.]MBV9956691.1 ABC transporter ATP-binding protein [Pseudolabrys sp.]